jgi:hypothetical protein
VISAAVQDSVFAVKDATWRQSARRFTVALQRFRWERAGNTTGAQGAPGERVASVLAFEAVLGVKAHKVAQGRQGAVASLLSVRFAPAAEPPGGTVSLLLAGGGEIRLEVECLDAVLADLGAAREALRRPDHGLDEGA